MEAVKKPKTEDRLDMENLGKQTETSGTSITNRIQEIEERISDYEDTIENKRSDQRKQQIQKFSSQNIQEIWDIIKKNQI